MKLMTTQIALTALCLSLSAAYAADKPVADGLPHGLPEWRSYRGNIGAGIVPDSGLQLIGAAEAKRIEPVWVSEDKTIPKGWLHPNGYATVGVTGGYGSPVAVGDRLYIAWWEPDTGSPVDTIALAAARDKNPDRWRVKADEVLLCVEIATGRTLWKARFDGTGGNDQFGNHCKNYTPAVADGAVVLAGNGGWLYCVEPADGLLRWKAKVGPFADQLAAWHAAGLDVGSGRAKGRNAVMKEKKLKALSYQDQNANPLIVAGLAVASDGTDGGGGKGMGLVAFDLATGRERWRVPDCLQMNCSPVLWQREGAPAVVAAGPNRVVAVAPADGKVLWELTLDMIPELEFDEEEFKEGKWRGPVGYKSPKRFGNAGTPALVGDLLVLKGNRPSPHPERFLPAPHITGPTCWNLADDPPTLKWRLPRNHDMFCPQKNSWVVYRDHLYMIGRQGACIVAMDSGEIVADWNMNDSFSSPVVSDGRIFHGGTMYVVDDPAHIVKVGLPVRLTNYTQSFYANGFLFTRGPWEAPDEGPAPKKGSPEAIERARAARDAVYCYDLRAANALNPTRAIRSDGGFEHRTSNIEH